MKIARNNQYHNNSFKNITFIHYKNNSFKNINLTYSSPRSQRNLLTAKEKLNSFNNHNYFNDNGSCIKNNYVYYCPKKNNLCKETPLKKIILNDKSLIKSKSSKFITIFEDQKTVNFPLNYSYYERRETSNKKEENKSLINNINNNKSMNVNDNNYNTLFKNNVHFMQNQFNNNKNEKFFINYMKNIQISNKNNNIKNNTLYNNNTRIIKSIRIGVENNNKKINSIISKKYYTNTNTLNIDDSNEFNLNKLKIINLSKKRKPIPLGQKENSLKNIKNKNIVINVMDNIENKENICHNYFTTNIKDSNDISEKLDRKNDFIKRKKIYVSNKLKIPINAKKNLSLKNNINKYCNTLNLTRNKENKIFKSYKSFQKLSTTNNQIDNDNNNNLKPKLKNNSHIKLINKNYMQFNSFTKPINNINQQSKYKTYSENNSSKNILHSNNEKTEKNINILNQNVQSRNKNHNSIIHKIPKTFKINEKSKEKKTISLNILADNRKKSYDSTLRINHFLTNTYNNNYIESNIFVKNIKAQSKAGRLEPHHIKINQDTYLIEQNINGILNFNLFGVLDGHGTDGHYVSKYVSKFIKNKLSNNPKIKYLTDPKKIYEKLKENNYKIIENIFLEAEKQIRHENFDSYLSGTTCVIIIQLEEKIICANCGDSRAILIYENEKNNLNNNNLKNTKIFPLSEDCKPNLPQEKYRIIKSGGTVEKSENEEGEKIGPYRVWKKNKDYPGLAMSRSIGDFQAKKVGVIPNPLFKEYIIDNNSKYLIVCSDGIWEFLSNENVMDICNKYYVRNDINGLCQELIKKATFWWEKEDDVIDDITVVAVFF